MLTQLDEIVLSGLHLNLQDFREENLDVSKQWSFIIKLHPNFLNLSNKAAKIGNSHCLFEFFVIHQVSDFWINENFSPYLRKIM